MIHISGTQAHVYDHNGNPITIRAVEGRVIGFDGWLKPGEEGSTLPSEPSNTIKRNLQVSELEEGRRYRITYSIGAKWDRMFIATYLGVDYRGYMNFDLRPRAGSTWLDPTQIRHIDRVFDDTPHVPPRTLSIP